MALTETQKLKLAEILDVTYIEVFDKIAYLDPVYFTAAVETLLIADIALWETAKTEFASFSPTESNKGFKLNHEAKKNQIRRSVAKKLYFENLGGNRLIRG
jgi:hypothetical protein